MEYIKMKDSHKEQLAEEKGLLQIAIDALEEIKALNIKVIDVTGKTSITDIMIICTGTSNRHVKSLAENVVKRAKESGYKPIGVEGEGSAEWVLVDLVDVVVHIMQPDIREFYKLERLWSVEHHEEPSDQA
jgi:ribosome-associated protein